MVLIDGGEFSAADDYAWEPIDVRLVWRDPTNGERGEEVVKAKPKVAQGVLVDLETNNPRGVMVLLSDCLLADDGETDEEGEIKPETTSRGRFNILIRHDTREIPGPALTKIIRGLYGEYTNRRNAKGATPRPTTSPAPSFEVPSRTGPTSTASPAAPASTSAG